MNTVTRISKIARLPHSIREQLNLKLHDGLPGKTILPWLNGLPEVKTILAADFDSRPITKQNLSEWKQGGHRDWLLQYQAAHFLQFIPPSSSSIPSQRANPPTTLDSPQEPPKDFTHHASRITEPALPTTDPNSDHSAFRNPHSALTSRLLLWTQLQYTAMARHIDAETDPERKWNALRQFSNDISRLRRSSLADDYLQIQRDWLALSQCNSSEKKELEFCKWINRPDIADAIKNKKRGLTRERLREIEEDLYLLGPDDPSLDEHIAQVRIARELMASRKAKEAEAKRQPGDPAPEPPRINLRDTTFEELFPTIPDKPLTELYPELDPMDPDRGKYKSQQTPPPPSQNGGQPAAHSSHGTAESPLPKQKCQHEEEETLPQTTPPGPDTSEKPALRSAFGEGGSNSSHPSDQPALRSPSSEALLAKADAPGEGGSNPACPAEASERRRVQPGPTQSNPPPPPETAPSQNSSLNPED
jgi:hypothetical protein